MAVPKKRRSKSRASSHHHIWKRDIVKKARRAVSLAKAILGGHTKFMLVNPGPTVKRTPQPKRPPLSGSARRRRKR